MESMNYKSPIKVRNIEIVNQLKEFYSLSSNIDLPKDIETQVIDIAVKKIDQDKKVVEKRLLGLNKEDEFVLTSLLLGNALQVTRLSQQKITQDLDYQIPDFLVCTRVPKIVDKDGDKINRFFVEVKKLSENESDFKITQDYFNKLKKYCKTYSLPLYFAIKLELGGVGFSQWALIFSDTVENSGQIKKLKIRKDSKEEDCYLFTLKDLLSKDFSGLWMDNHLLFLSEGSVYRKVYDINKESPIHITSETGEDLGGLVEVELKNGSISEKVTFEKDKHDVRDIIFYNIAMRIARGKETIQTTNTTTEKIIEADKNYSIPLYHLVLEIYLHLRSRFGESWKEPRSDISFYLSHLTDFDYKISYFIRDIIINLHKNNIIKLIRMVPDFLMENDD
ncbi:MAG: hypothetical protein HYU56_02395 [Candidatus Aenigmarchaeota archaeon]|nr:hypothetical protein [Candidatus Aenigmarchaeota archaeon]